MQSTITRLALFQFAAIIYATLFNGMLLKFSFDRSTPPIFATHLRDYGFLLLLLPAAWLLFASVEAHRPLVDTGDVDSILVSGIVLVAGLALVGFIGTISACAAMAPYDMVRVASEDSSPAHHSSKARAMLHRVPEEGASDSKDP
jgi:hypothetical protein